MVHVDFIDLFHDSMCALSVMRRGRISPLCTKPALPRACLKLLARNSTPRSLYARVPKAQASMTHGRGERAAGQCSRFLPARRAPANSRRE